MIRHILLLRPRPAATTEEIEACRAAVTALVGRIPGVRNCFWGENLATPDRSLGFSHGFSMDFIDLDALHAYLPHPVHQAAGALVRATFEQIAVLDLPVEGS